MKKNRLSVLMLAFAMTAVLLLAGCAGQSESAEPAEPEAETETEAVEKDLVQYPDIWDAIHARLPEFGFILRFPESGEAITGYAYEPWHIRYLDSPEIAKEITGKGITLEEYFENTK